MTEQKNYEFAYLLSSSIAEGAVLAYTGKLTGLIEEGRGVIRHVEEPKRRQFAYPVKKQKTGYFGWTTFAMAPEALAELKKKLKSFEEILRILLVEEEIEKRQPFLRSFAPRAAKPWVTPKETARSDEKLDLEALDKKLEEILGK